MRGGDDGYTLTLRQLDGFGKVLFDKSETYPGDVEVIGALGMLSRVD